MNDRKTAVFILSADYSGSTWVGYVLGSNQDSAFLGEYYRAWHEGYSQPCTICAAKGLAECDVLHGIESVPVKQAFAWGFDRTGKRVLIDSSKVTHWAARALDRADDYEVRLIHLVRDPRGWLASQRRRMPELSHVTMMPRWLETNTEIRDFARTTAHPYRTLMYDDLTHDAAGEFANPFEFCGMTFAGPELAYWNVEHHGFAANGATSPTIPGNVAREQIPHFVTRDEDFYAANKRSQFTDDRWKHELPASERDGILGDQGVSGFLASIERRMTAGGIVDVRRSGTATPGILARAWTALRARTG